MRRHRKIPYQLQFLPNFNMGPFPRIRRAFLSGIMIIVGACQKNMDDKLKMKNLADLNQAFYVGRQGVITDGIYILKK